MCQLGEIMPGLPKECGAAAEAASPVGHIDPSGQGPGQRRFLGKRGSEAHICGRLWFQARAYIWGQAYRRLAATLHNSL